MTDRVNPRDVADIHAHRLLAIFRKNEPTAWDHAVQYAHDLVNETAARETILRAGLDAGAAWRDLKAFSEPQHADAIRQLWEGMGSPTLSGDDDPVRDLISHLDRLGLPVNERARHESKLGETVRAEPGDNGLEYYCAAREGIVLPMPGMCEILEPMRGDLVSLGGERASGKSTLAHQVVDGYAEAGGCVLFVPYEQSPRRLEIMRMCRKTQLIERNLRDLSKRAEVSRHVERVMSDDREQRRGDRFRYLDRAPRSPADAAQAIRLALDGFDADGFDPQNVVVVIDSTHNQRGASEDRRMDVEIIADTSKDLAVEVRNAVVTVCHTNEAGQVRESRYFEYAADVLLRVDVKKDSAGMDSPVEPPLPPADKLNAPYAVKARTLRLIKQKHGVDGYSTPLLFHTGIRAMIEAPNGG